jgi:two-component system sensor histidine kinase ChvG
MDAIGVRHDVAHEIKPATSLRSAVETVARIDDPAQQRRLMTIILDDVQRLNRLITDISDASRVDAEMSRQDGADRHRRDARPPICTTQRATARAPRCCSISRRTRR